LSLKGHVSTRGLVPRNFKLCGSSGQWLVVGNQVMVEVEGEVEVEVLGGWQL
jgi:hypothetical protein